jgi:hypothetical protein
MKRFLKIPLTTDFLTKSLSLLQISDISSKFSAIVKCMTCLIAIFHREYFMHVAIYTEVSLCLYIDTLPQTVYDLHLAPYEIPHIMVQALSLSKS